MARGLLFHYFFPLPTFLLRGAPRAIPVLPIPRRGNGARLALGGWGKGRKKFRQKFIFLVVILLMGGHNIPFVPYFYSPGRSSMFRNWVSKLYRPRRQVPFTKANKPIKRSTRLFLDPLEDRLAPPTPTGDNSVDETTAADAPVSLPE